MFKRIVRAALIGAGIFVGMAAVLYAYMQPVWTTPIANESGLAYNKTFAFQTNNAHVDTLSFQCVYTSATVATQTFTDGTQSTGTIVVSSSPFPVPAGMAAARICINTVCVIAGRDWNWDTAAKSTATATSIMTALNTVSGLTGVIVSTTGSNSSTIFSTSTAVGTSSNYAIYSSTQAALKIVAGAVTTDTAGGGTSVMTGGTNAAFSLGSPLITVANNPFTPLDPTQTSMVGLQVLYSTPTVAISPLIGGTTYFVVPVDRNTFKLATSAANAIAGTAITLTSSSTQTTAHTYTLAPLLIAGTPGFQWDVSNNGSAYTRFLTTQYNVAVASVTMSAYTFGGATSVWDFGSYDYTWVRLNVTAPTAGAISIKCTPNGENQSGNF